MKNTVIVIPTYNEADTIKSLIQKIRLISTDLYIFIVDDSSPDGTTDVVREIMSTDKKVRLILRNGKQGLASAYLDAFARIVPVETFERVMTMDADFSHDPQYIPKLIAESRDNDVVVGSRYLPEGQIKNWALTRKLLSRYGNLYARIVTKTPVYDLTAGFVLYNKDILEKILQRGIQSEGYAYQIEMKYTAYKLGGKIKEIPIVFYERQSGVSKLSRATVWEGVIAPWRMRTRG